MTELRCKPGDLAVIVNAHCSCNLGRIVKVIRRDSARGDLFYPPTTPVWWVQSPQALTWRVDMRRVRRKQGPVPDAQLQTIKGAPQGKDMADSPQVKSMFDKSLIPVISSLKGISC